MKFWTFLVFAFVIAQIGIAQTLTPSHDVWYKDNFSGGVTFNTNELKVRGVDQEYIFLQFDLSSISGSVQSAVLEMTMISSTGGGTIDIFKSADVVWTESAGFDTYGRPTYDPATDQVNTDAPSSYSSTGTYAWTLDPAAFTTGSKITLVVSKASARNIFASKENSSSTGPRLILTTGGGPTATCTDDIQNGNETGVDCGGPDCPACVGNIPPTASFDVPNDGQNFVEGANLLVETTASDSDGSIAHVELFYDGVSKGQKSLPSYNWFLENLAVGTHTLQVIATDNESATDEQTISVTVNEETTGGGDSFWLQSGNNIYYNNGNVGIGTTTPIHNLHIVGTAMLERDAGPASFILNRADGKSLALVAGGGGSTFRFDETGSFKIQSQEASELLAGVGATTIRTIVDVSGSAPDNSLWLNSDGYLGIGTTNPSALLTVAGDAHIRKVKITVDAGADFVFQNGYQLPKLEEVAQFVKENKHLPGIASEQEMLDKGVDVGEFNIQLLQKIEEMTLYMIDFQEEMKVLQAENAELKAKVEALEQE